VASRGIGRRFAIGIGVARGALGFVVELASGVGGGLRRAPLLSAGVRAGFLAGTRAAAAALAVFSPASLSVLESAPAEEDASGIPRSR